MQQPGQDEVFSDRNRLRKTILFFRWKIFSYIDQVA